MTSELLYAIIASASVLGFLVILFLNKRIASIVVNDAKAAKIALAIRTGAMIFLREEYKIIHIKSQLRHACLGNSEVKKYSEIVNKWREIECSS